MMTRCSRATLFRRFHGFTDGAAYARALFVDRAHDETLAARNPSMCRTAASEPSPSESSHCVVGLGTLSPTTEGAAEMGVLVEDAWQQRGVGSRLIAELIARARRNGISTVHADVLEDNQFLLQILRRAAPLTVAFQRGGFSVDIDLGGG
jgi:GNAT superfamily N-acetyltransferase